MCQRASNNFLAQNLATDRATEGSQWLRNFREFVVYSIFVLTWLALVRTLAHAFQATYRSIFSITTPSYIQNIESVYFDRTPVRSKISSCVLNSRILPFLSLLRSSVSFLPDKNRQSFFLWSAELVDALAASKPLSPTRRSSFQIRPTIILDRNHFLVLVNGRSPPEIAPC